MAMPTMAMKTMSSIRPRPAARAPVLVDQAGLGFDRDRSGIAVHRDDECTGDRRRGRGERPAGGVEDDTGCGRDRAPAGQGVGGVGVRQAVRRMHERRSDVAWLVAAAGARDRRRHRRSGDAHADVAPHRDRRFLGVAEATGDEVAPAARGELALVEQLRHRDRGEDAGDHHDDHQLGEREAALPGDSPCGARRAVLDQRAHISVTFAAVTPVPLGVRVQTALAALVTRVQSPVPPTWNWSSAAGAPAVRVTLVPVSIGCRIAAVQMLAALTVTAPALPAALAAKLIDAPDARAPATPLAEALWASTERSTNFGTATAARTPRMMMTTISSIRVKPRWFFISVPCRLSLRVWVKVYRLSNRW